MTGPRRRPGPQGGRLLVVATPLGNLGDLTLRAMESLRSADLVVCEDTRRTRALLTHLGVRVRTVSCHKFNEASRIPEILSELSGGSTVALVSDAGTPGLSDPGSRLVAAARDAGHAVEPVPGPSAPAAAISAAGFEAGGFLFAGYPPARAGARRKFFEAVAEGEQARLARDLSAGPWPIVFFEAPHRIAACLGDLAETLGDRRMVLFREMTKVHEEAVRGTIREVADRFEEAGGRGEFTLVVEGAAQRAARAPLGRREIAESYRRLVDSGVDRREALRRLARSTGLRRREIYDVVAGGGGSGGEEAGG